MSARSFIALLFLVAVSLPAFGTTSASAPVLFGLSNARSQTLAQGAQQLIPVKINEDQAFAAIFKGGMWIPDGAGGRVYAQYKRHILHDNGDWTFVGTVQTAHGSQSAVITFGPDAVFGRIPQSSGYPLRLLTAQGQTFLLRTNAAALAHLPRVKMLYAQPDDPVPLRLKTAAQSRSATAGASAQDGASSGATIDVMVAYTPGFVTEYGTVPAALTRIDNLVDLTNQAYSDSQVHQSIRLVHTMQVNYTDDNSNTTALDNLTGNDGNGNSVPIPAGLQPVAPARTQYGADLVVLIRSFVNASQGGCGLGWLIGGGEQQIVPSQDYVFGYSVVSDGSDDGYYCLDSTFAHELGHNMGDAHDRANANGPGAYPYSYGYVGNGTYGFSTIMAYGTDTDTPLNVFSNPNISICQNTPCGVADSSSNSADNAHSMNNTSSLIAQFEPTEVPPAHGVHNDINGDGKSDILFFNPSTNGLVYWLMNGSRFVSYNGFSAGSGYVPVGTGDLDGNGMTDILWNGNGTLYVWLNNGSGGFTSTAISSYPGGWQLVGCRDVDGDGQDDILWYHPGLHQFVYWIMSGAQLIRQHETNVTPGFTAIGAGDFNGDGMADIAWRDGSGHVYVWIGNGTNFTQYPVNVSAGSSWTAAGIGDVNGDGDSDIFWYQPSSGNVQYWLMSGQKVIGYKIFNTGPGYTFAGVGDFDGDGYADILWTRNNVLSMWLHYDPYDYYGVTVRSYATGWNVLP